MANYDFTYTGTEIQAILDTGKKLKDSGYIFLGVATPSTNPGTPTQKVYYEAKQAGTYTNFGGVVLPDGLSLLIWNGSWTSKTVMCGDGGVFDISVYKSSGGTLATFADLAAALDGGNNIPASARKGGMSVKFVQSSDNKYIQARCMAQNFTTDVTQWQGVDDEPTAGSDNLVKSGGVDKSILPIKYIASQLTATSTKNGYYNYSQTFVESNDYVTEVYDISNISKLHVRAERVPSGRAYVIRNSQNTIVDLGTYNVAENKDISVLDGWTTLEVTHAANINNNVVYKYDNDYYATKLFEQSLNDNSEIITPAISGQGCYDVSGSVFYIVSGAGVRTGRINISNVKKIEFRNLNTGSARKTVITDKYGTILHSFKEEDTSGTLTLNVADYPTWYYLYSSGGPTRSLRVALYYNKADDVIFDCEDEVRVVEFTEETNTIEKKTGYSVSGENGTVFSDWLSAAVSYINIPILPNKNIILSLSGMISSPGVRGYAFYDINGEYISGGVYSKSVTKYEITSPDNAYFLSFSTTDSVGKFHISLIDIEEYEIINSLSNKIIELKRVSNEYEAESQIDVILPSKLTGVVNHNTNLLLPNIAIGDYNIENCHKFRSNANVSIGNGEVQIIPSEVGVINSNITIQKSYYSEAKVYPLNTYVVAQNTGDGVTKKIILIGDSTSEAPAVPDTLNSLFEDDAMHITMEGTRETPSGVKHEARSGWSSQDFCYTASKNSGTGGTTVTNSFYNPSVQHFDFAYYLSQYSIATPDIVIITLGLNDIDGGINTVQNINFMITSIRQAAPNTIIIVGLPNLPSAFPNSWHYGSHRRERVLLKNKALMQEFDNRENDNIFVSPLYLYVNPLWDMPYGTDPINCRNPKRVDVMVGPGPTHPNDYGSMKIADCHFNTIKYIQSVIENE
jgi:hypothetical protein